MTLSRLFFRPFVSLRSVALATLMAGMGPIGVVAETQITFGTYAADKPTETVRKFKPS
jgi:uncharacterized protein YaiE (UPF0345 family)